MKKILLLIALCFVVACLYAGYKLINFAQSRSSQVTFAVQEPFMKKVEAHIYKVTKRSSVYEFVRKAYYTFGVPRKGLIHVGAREAEELEYYMDHDVKDVLWIEADPAAEQPLKKAVAKHPGSKVAMFAATDENGTIMLHKTSNTGHSSSILKLKNHLIHYPSIVETEVVKVPQRRLDDYLSPEDKQHYNIIVMDIQGAELIALHGAFKTLETVDAIIAEVNYDELYEGGVLIGDLDAFLAKFGFTRVDVISIAYYTGDALYIKNKFFKPITNTKR